MKEMSDRAKIAIINVSIVAGLVWCYLRGYSLGVISISALLLFSVANAVLYFKRR